MKKKQVAVLMSCYNRRDTTLSCIAYLYQQGISFRLYLVDDGSCDGTSAAVERKYPDVEILPGDGNLYWVGGMYWAFAEAMQHNYEYYLWLNDDTLLEPHAINTLLDTHNLLCDQGKSNSIIVGSVKDPITNEYSYGGRVRSPRNFSHTFDAVKPTQEPQECDTMQGNIVLIPRFVAKQVGNLEAAFTHQRGDLDYGLRAKQLGCSVFVAPGYLGTCPQNSVSGSWVDMSLSPDKRLKKALQIKAFPPKEWAIFTKRHSGFFWFIYWTFPYIRALIGYKNLNYSPTFKQEKTYNSSKD